MRWLSSYAAWSMRVQGTYFPMILASRSTLQFVCCFELACSTLEIMEFVLLKTTPDANVLLMLSPGHAMKQQVLWLVYNRNN